MGDGCTSVFVIIVDFHEWQLHGLSTEIIETNNYFTECRQVWKSSELFRVKLLTNEYGVAHVTEMRRLNTYVMRITCQATWKAIT